MRSIWLLLALSACGDKAVQLSIQPPVGAAATDFDPSCIGAVYGTAPVVHVSVTGNGRTVQRTLAGNDEGVVAVVVKL